MLPEVPHDHPLLVQFREDPYPLYRYLLSEAPVQWNDVLGAWTIARYADVVAVLTDARFSVERSLALAGEQSIAELGNQPSAEALELRKLQTEALDAQRVQPAAEARAPQKVQPPVEPRFAQPGAQPMARSMLFADPPDHTRLRSLVSKAFTPRMIEQLRPRIAAIVDALIDAILARGAQQFDLIDDLAYPLPVQVIAELLGVPLEDRVQFHEWSSAVAASLDPLVSEASMERAIYGREQLYGYFRSLIVARRREPRDDLISSLVAVEEQGERLSEPELLVMCNLLLIAGHETTVNLIGNGMLALLRNRDQLERLRAAPESIGTAVEELLRYDSPVQLTARIARAPLRIGEQDIQAGDWVLTLLGAANHDPAQFAEPDVLDLGRNPNAHVAFGRGIHFCLGAPLARLEGQMAIGALVKRMPRLELAGAPERREQMTLRGLRHLPVSSGG